MADLLPDCGTPGHPVVCRCVATDTVARLIRAREISEALWAPVLPEATRRLLHDALLTARARSTAALIREDRRGAFAAAWTDRDQHLAEWAAAVALVIAERPELITGDVDRRRPAADVLAEALARRVPTHLPLSAVREAAAHLLAALTDAGWDLIRRADRFATLADDARRIRIPTRGRCLTCYVEVSRGVDAGRGEVVVGPWQHIDPDAPHRNDAITTVDAP